MSTFNSPTDILPVTKALSSTINNLDSATAQAFSFLPDETRLTIGTVGFGVDSGTANTYVITHPQPLPIPYSDGFEISFNPLNNNTGASTVNVSSIGVKSIRAMDNTPLNAGDIRAGIPTSLRYSSTTGFFHLTSPSPNVISSISVTQATETSSGISEIGTQTEVNAGTSDNVIVTPLKLALLSSRNQIINPVVNGGMMIWAAGTSFPAAVNLAYDADGWTNENTSAAVFKIEKIQIAMGLTNHSFSQRRLTVTTADSTLAAGDYVAQRNAIEGYDVIPLIGNTFTIGFWVLSTVTGIHCLSVYNGTSSYVVEYTVNATNTPEFKTITIPGGLQTAASFSNAAGAYLFFGNMAGSTYQTTAGAWVAGFKVGTVNQANDMATNGNLFQLGDVFINMGSYANPNRLSYEQELRRDKRYFQIIRQDAGFNGDVTSGATYYCNYNLPVEMRTTPAASGVNQSANRFPAATGTVSPITASYIYETRVASSTGSGGFFGSTITALARL